MKLIEFAEKHLKRQEARGRPGISGRKLKRIDGCNSLPNPEIPDGLPAGHIFEYSSTRMALVFMPRRPKVWVNMS